MAGRPSQQLGLISDTDLLGMVSLLAGQPLRGVVAEGGLGREQAVKLRAALTRPRSLRRPLHPSLDRGAPIQSLAVADYRSKEQAVAQLSNWSRRQGLSHRGIACIEQAVDELLLNALFDAPHDGAGRPRYLGLPPHQRQEAIDQPSERALVRYASDPQRLVVGVRDRFGTLRRTTVLRYLDRCASAQQTRRSPLENKGAGAGVGLFLVAEVASELLFHLVAGRSTEVVFVVYRQQARPLRALVIDDDAKGGVHESGGVAPATS